MGLWYKPQEWFKKFRKKDLREVCREKYGDDFVEMYDMVNNGIPIGNLEKRKSSSQWSRRQMRARHD